MFDPATITFLESGCALIVGSVNADGEPMATRGWGLTVLSRDPTAIRVLLDSDEEQTLDNLRTTGRVAVTATSVLNSSSLQLKGRLRSIEPALDADDERASQYCDDFFRDIVEIDRTPMEIVERLRPAHYVVCIIDVEDVYNQTPGPGAGTAVNASSS